MLNYLKKVYANINKIEKEINNENPFNGCFYKTYVWIEHENDEKKSSTNPFKS